MMLNHQYDKIDAYEKEWRKKHKIPNGHPSTLSEEKPKESKISTAQPEESVMSKLN